MKTFFAMGLSALMFVACNESQTDNTTSTDSVATTNDVNATTSHMRPSTEGDVTYSERRVRVYRNNTWEDANEDVKLENGIVIYRDGRAMKDGVEVELEDGYVVDRDGNVWDRTGNAVSDAWDATKHGVKKAGKAVGEAAEELGHKAKDVVD